MVSYDFLITSLIIVLIPGTGVIYTVSTGIFLGFRSSVIAAFGCTLGIVPHITASILGLSAILHLSAVVFNFIKYAGVLYLLYLAVMMWKETGSLSFNKGTTEKRAFKIAVRAILINILNPKLTIFFMAFLPQFINQSSSSPVNEMTLLSLIFMLMTFVVFVIYGFAANQFSRYVTESKSAVKIMQRSFAFIFAALGLKLALTEK